MNYKLISLLGLSFLATINSCDFCTITNTQNHLQVIAEHNSVVAIKKLRPVNHVNFLIIPKTHYKNLTTMNSQEIVEFFKDACELLEMLRNKRSQTTSGQYTIQINNGELSAQTMFHLHMHVMSPDASWRF